MYMKRKPVDGRSEQHLGYDPAVSPIQGACTHFLTSLISDLQERFARGGLGAARGTTKLD